jgi:predicted MarR family transcription regulator
MFNKYNILAIINHTDRFNRPADIAQTGVTEDTTPVTQSRLSITC